MVDQPDIERQPPGEEVQPHSGEQPPPPQPSEEGVGGLPFADPAPTSARAPGRSLAPWLALGGLVVVGLIVGNILLLTRVSELQEELDAGFAEIDERVLALAGSLGSVSDLVVGVDERLASFNALAVTGTPESSTAPQAAVTGGLPLYDASVQDPALGAIMNGITGPEYYSGQTLEIDSADGKARAWLVWAHWCPYCQEELPEVKAWVEANAAAFPDFEIVSLTTAMDESRGNSLVPYLEELQLPFPVIVDDDGSLSAQLGLNAFPFWVFTGPDGTVLGRTAGLLGTERFASIAQQLQDLASS